MRELHAWHEAERDSRHAPDAAADTPAASAHDSPRHAVLRDLAARVAKHLEYRKIIEAAEARCAAGQLKPQEVRPEHAPLETRDKPAGKIAERRLPPEDQQQEQRRPERPRLPSDSTMQVVVGVSDSVASWRMTAGTGSVASSFPA